MTDIKSIYFPPPIADDMVCAILEGRKTVTRRVVKPKPLWQKPPIQQKNNLGYWGNWDDRKIYKAPYRPGDILYVRETWTHTCIHCEHYPDVFFCQPDCGTCPDFVYKADGILLDGWPDKRWRPSIHMPREAARIFLRVTDVRVERLQDISASACIAEGIPWEDVTPNIAALSDNPAFDMDAVVASLQEAEEQKLIRNSYGLLWDSIIKPKDIALYGWKANPWVWVIEFERIGKEEMRIDG